MSATIVERFNVDCGNSNVEQQGWTALPLAVGRWRMWYAAMDCGSGVGYCWLRQAAMVMEGDIGDGMESTAWGDWRCLLGSQAFTLMSTSVESGSTIT
jgi:hypothetical protein